MTEPEFVDLDRRDMFRRYADIVGREEGVDFLWEGMGDWTPEEWAAIRALIDGSICTHSGDHFCEECEA